MARPDAPPDAPAYAALGPHPVGVRNASVRRGVGDAVTRVARTGDASNARPTRPLPVTVWYPARDDGRRPPRSSYAYPLKFFVRIDRLARVAGRARWNAPAETAAGAYPLVVLSPGFAMGRTGYAWLAERLASHGFVVVAVGHDERMTEDFGDLWRGVVTRPSDVRAVLDWVASQSAPGMPLAGRVDLERVAVVGHSLGGATALAAAGARLDLDATAELCAGAAAEQHPATWLCSLFVEHAAPLASLAGLDAVPEGPWPAAGDPRVSAVVTLAGDAFPFGPAGLAAVAVPVLAVGGSRDSASPLAWSTEPAYRFSAGPRAARAVLDGAEHMVFAASCGAAPLLRVFGTEMLCGDAVWDVERAHDAAAHLTVAFLRAELAGDSDARAALSPERVALSGVDYDARGYGAESQPGAEPQPQPQLQTQTQLRTPVHP